LREIARYIALELKEPSTARNVVARIAQAVFELDQLPQRHEQVRDKGLANRGIRMLPVDRYIIFYSASEANEVVSIIRILYNKRNWIELL